MAERESAIRLKHGRPRGSKDFVDTHFGTPMDSFNTNIIDVPILPQLDNFE